MHRIARLAIILIPCAWGLAPCGFTEYLQRPEAQAFIDDLVREHQLERAGLEQALSEATRSESVLEAISRPAERRLPWYEYREIFLQPVRVHRGVQFWKSNREPLERAHAEYGVPPEVVVAIMGVETDYGRIMGSFRALDALATLAFDYPPRADFFRKELGQFLMLAEEEGGTAEDYEGSYAGALGMAQFMPSSFRAYAVDFSGDDRRDIWTSSEDAIGSVANYLAVHGWYPGGRVILPVTLNEEADPAKLRFEGDFREAPTRAHLEAGGVVFADPDWSAVGDEVQLMLVELGFESGPANYAGFNNFYVITRYNRSHMYAMAVHRLSQMVREEMDGQAG